MREVRIRDTLSGEMRTLDPAEEVGIYACGPTVYSRIHIGNARPFVVFSLFARFLRSEGYRSRLVVNITDINDKIYVDAEKAGEPSSDFAARMTRAYLEDTNRLGLGRPDGEPLATATVGGIVALIAELVDAGHAYEAGGDVYFRVRSFGAYGKLSNRRAEDMDQGEEAGSASLKEDGLDFALWKAHKQGEDTHWDSPWGPGRPGWHIECSAMAEAELGASFAIHGGGSDLVFPHHENEIAQSEAAGRPFARVWMHNGMVETADAKMSKSDGNIFQLSEALDRYGREAVVAYLISGHYRQPLAFGAEQMDEAVARVERLRNFFREHPVEGEPGEVSSAQQRGGSAAPPPPAPPPPRQRLAWTLSARRWLMTSIRRGLWPRCLSWSVKRIVAMCPGRRRLCSRCWSWSGSSRSLPLSRALTPVLRLCWPSGSRLGRIWTSGGLMRFGMSLRRWAGKCEMVLMGPSWSAGEAETAGRLAPPGCLT